MSEMPSSEFRKQYARLTEPTFVTVNGHVIGQWLPNGFLAATVYEFGDDVLDPRPGSVAISQQSKRDDLLRKINRSR